MAIPPIRITVEVDADPDGAFSRFVDRFGDWWPHTDSGLSTREGLST